MDVCTLCTDSIIFMHFMDVCTLVQIVSYSCISWSIIFMHFMDAHAVCTLVRGDAWCQQFDLTYSTLSSLAAAYNTEKVPPPHSPAYSFGLPVYHSGADPRSQTPAPNAYVLPHLIGTVTQVKAASPAYSIAGRRISGSFHDDLHKVTDASTIRPLRVYICSLHYIVTISIIFGGGGGGGTVC